MIKPIKLLLLLLLLSSSAIAQTTKQIDNISKKLQDFSVSFPQEKVYLHTDRKYYSPGETVWFQAYLTAGYYHEPSPFSTNIHVTLFNAKKEPISQVLTFAQEGFGKGQINLPDTIPAGSYVLKAYTTWMRNFNDEFFFEKELVVVSNGEEIARAERKANEKIDLQFFPEGGYLVDDIPTKVAFKAVDPSGMGMDISGVLYDNSGQELSSFTTQHDGMGAFAITPQAGQQYTVKLEDSGEKYNLPDVQREGFSLAVTQPEGALKLTFSTNGNTRTKGKYTVIIHTRGVISYAFDIDLSKKVAIGNVPTDIIPDGITHITLFDEDDNALVERLVFIDQPSNKINLTTDKEKYRPREKVSTKIKVENEKGEPVSGVFSMAAIDLGQTLDSLPENTIYSALLLNSDLTGYLDDPMYYFNSKNPLAKTHLDLVMMTHGWRRFEWKNMVNDVYPSSAYGVDQGINISGTMFRELSEKPEGSGKVTFVSQQSVIPTILEAETAKDGRFNFENLTVFEDDEILLRGENYKGKKTVWLQLDSIPEDVPPVTFKSILSENKLEPAEKESFIEQNEQREQIEEAYSFDSTVFVLESVVVEASRTEATNERIERTAYGSGTDSFNFLDWPSNNAVSDVFTTLVGKFPGVSIIVGTMGGDPKITIRQSGFQTPPPLILLDDVAVDISIVSSMPADNFSRVVLFKGTSASAIFGSAGMGGALAFYTKGADGIVIPKTKQNNSVLVTKLANSFQQPKEFYAPKYDVQKPEHVKPDRRIVLHWQPMITLDENGEALIEFWNSDQITNILLDVQGLSLGGDPFQATKIYSIEKR